MKQALIIIDMQEIFFMGEENALYNREQLITHVNEWIAGARHAQVPIVFIQHTSYTPGEELYVDTPEWQICSQLARQPEDTVIRKTSWDSFYQTELLEWLKQNGIEQLIFAGAQTEFCLDTTIRAAYSLGYQRNLIAIDSHSTLDNSILNAQQIIQHHQQVWNGRFANLQSIDIAFHS
ncbi:MULTISPECIES: cysteine hydrolase family protein [Paenibacillus]|uniref:cysteine hydrolase family protein n=1 Tax=Paenibacillus TaxID=44249 RepID=UPI000362C3DA|nr:MULTISPECIES: cysteine hydrolase family protein [Paenibacillus]